MDNILVTGAAGYIGSHCVKELMKHGYRCIAVDNMATGHEKAILSPVFYKFDLADSTSLDRLFQKHKVSAVMHFAASTHVGESVTNPSEYYANNTGCTFNLLDAMVRNNVKKIIFSSTCAIYGNPAYLPLDEMHPQNPINPYGKSKYISEKAFEDYKFAYDLQYISLRYFNVAGCDLDGVLGDYRSPPTLLIPLVLEVASGNRPHITIFGNDYETPDGTCVRDYIHVQDIVTAHRLALKKVMCSPESYALNIGTGIGSTVKEIIEATKRVTGKNIAVCEGSRRAGDPEKLFASNQKAKEVLGWEPSITNLEDIIASTWEWMKKHQ